MQHSNPRFTRRDFYFIAELLGDIADELNLDANQRERMAKTAAAHLRETNGQFNTGRFVEAATS